MVLLAKYSEPNLPTTPQQWQNLKLCQVKNIFPGSVVKLRFGLVIYIHLIAWHYYIGVGHFIFVWSDPPMVYNCQDLPEISKNVRCWHDKNYNFVTEWWILLVWWTYKREPSTYFNVLGLLGVYIQGFICDSAKSFVKVLSFVDFGHVCYLSHPICFGVPDFSRGRCYATMYDWLSVQLSIKTPTSSTE